MSDLIDRQALKAYVNSLSTHPLNEWDTWGVLAAIDEQPTVAASPWHRVEDDYPDLLQFVVVCNDDGKCVVAQYVGYQTGSLTPWRIAYTMYDTDAYYEMENGPVRYWMPIEPPKEDE